MAFFKHSGFKMGIWRDRIDRYINELQHLRVWTCDILADLSLIGGHICSYHAIDTFVRAIRLHTKLQLGFRNTTVVGILYVIFRQVFLLLRCNCCDDMQ